MRQILSMWLGSAALAAALSRSDPLTSLNDQLAVESKSDADAADNARCWCKEVQSAVDARLRTSESEISELERIRDTRFYENVGLNVEVKQHQEQIDDHTQSLSTADSLSSRSANAHASEKQETTKALESLRKALAKVPKGNEVHGTLSSLEDSFASKLEEANKEHERQQAQSKDLNEAKTEMLRLAKSSKNLKTQRLADGKVIIAQAKSDIAAYSGQREADWALSSTLKSVCGNIADSATKRENERQDTVIAISEEKAKIAQSVAQKSMSKVMLLSSKSAVEARCSKVLELLGGSFQGDCAGSIERAEDAKRRADENFAAAKKAAADITALMDKSSSIQAGLTKVLNQMIMDAHLATTKGTLQSGIKAKVDTLGATADADLKATPALMDKVRAKARESTQADMKVVSSLQMGAATAGQAVVTANQCK